MPLPSLRELVAFAKQLAAKTTPQPEQDDERN